jgi:hypothetical protein
VTARLLLAIFDSVYLVALTAWVGSILFFSFTVAPIIFRVLGPEAGGKFVRALFPRYYLWGVISCAVALPALICGALSVPEAGLGRAVRPPPQAVGVPEYRGPLDRARLAGGLRREEGPDVERDRGASARSGGPCSALTECPRSPRLPRPV